MSFMGMAYNSEITLQETYGRLYTLNICLVASSTTHYRLELKTLLNYNNTMR